MDERKVIVRPSFEWWLLVALLSVFMGTDAERIAKAIREAARQERIVMERLAREQCWERTDG